MIQIVIAEDQGMLLGALSALISMEEDLEVVGTAKNGQEALELVHKHQPDICIMDIEMPVKTGLDAAEALKDDPCKVIILTTFVRSGYFERARKADVRGYLLKDSPIEELVLAIRQVMKGRRIYAPELVDIAFDDFRENPLTNREHDVLKWIADGKTTKQIAEGLHLTEGTVRNYVSTIFEKLEVSNRIEAVSLYKEKGWLK